MTEKTPGENAAVNPATMEQWKEIYSPQCRKGLFLHFEREVHDYVRDWLCEYARWLRKNYVFPVRIHVYCRYGDTVPCRYSAPAASVMLMPDDRNCYANIRLACGSFRGDGPVTNGMWDETQGIMYLLTRHIMHYYQFINGRWNVDESGERILEWQASYYAGRILHRFLDEYDDDDT